ncbi:hypothetical protein R3W88_000818 [Solanum pinnatisectum]|uniref:DUF1985 domain-containing protein n=1 Tax=Solanum pinnatisectum TaxID=50273 RepID=A0AAV9MGR3_9SOLN|nr:hypothetical protein R3W88_000818 [Solanum pinnatisectum]
MKLRKKNKKKNEVEDDGIKIVNAHTLPFVHNVLLAKDVNNNIALKLVKLYEDIEAFNNYPWGHDIYELTVKFLLAPFSPKTNNLFGFPWAFIAFEAITHLRHQVTAEEEISSLRILRWLRAKNIKNPPNLFNPPHDAVVHPWLVPTEKEMQMSYLITLGFVETLFDSVVDIVKRELLGATTIKISRLDDHQLVVFNEDDLVDAAVRAGVNISAGPGIGIGVGYGVQSVRATFCSRYSGFLCEKCKKHNESYIMYLQTLSQAVNEFKNKTGVKVIPSKNVRDPYTPQAKRRKKPFIKAMQNLKKKIFGELPMAIGEKQLELKHVNLYKNYSLVMNIIRVYIYCCGIVKVSLYRDKIKDTDKIIFCDHCSSMTQGFRRQNQNIDRLEKEKEKLTQYVHSLEERIKMILQSNINQTIPLQKTDNSKSSPSHSKMDKMGVHSPKNVERVIVLAKDTASPVQTVTGKDLSNPLMADTLLKSVRILPASFKNIATTGTETSKKNKSFLLKRKKDKRIERLIQSSLYKLLSEKTKEVIQEHPTRTRTNKF